MSTVIVENARQMGKYEAIRLENTQLRKHIAAYEDMSWEICHNVANIMGLSPLTIKDTITAFQKAVRDTLSEGE